MDNDEFNPDKKGLPILGIILMVIGLLGYIAYMICNWYLKIIPNIGLDWAFLIGVIAVFCAGIGCTEVAKKKKYGSRKLLRVSEMLSWGLVIVLILGILLRFFVKV
ncbi:MAG TPA: hypothetical protein O0X50_00750 [Methanocorpusculum sp.]|nr:hypothetical protein [Methanocorpusculum sp.]